MIDLNEIKDYVQKTTEIISSVLDMQVIICDSNKFLLGDSHPYWSPESKQINDTSILTKVMNEGKGITLDSLEKHRGCLECKNRRVCEVKAIIGVPIIYEGKVMGAIGILADTLSAKEKLLEKKDDFLDFINRMSELLISRLNEREQNIQLRGMRQQLISIIESIDSGIIAFDKNERIIYYNNLICDFLNKTTLNDNKEVFISDVIDEKYLRLLIIKHENFKNREIIFKKDGVSTFALISGKTITVEGRYVGGIITMKKLSDVYNEVNEFSNTNIFTSFKDIIGDSKEIIEIKEKAYKIAKSSSTVIIQGESGTGKEIFARAIHGSSDVSSGPFIAINCAAIPDTLLESELFGYEEGAFSGAKKGGKIGKFHLADSGTIFLDEIGEMPLHLQTKLLRVLQERTIERLGGSQSIPINVRVIAATNKNLDEMITTGEFREDLFYRLNVIPIYIPPLRKRQKDIPLIMNHFLDIYNKRLNKNIKGFSDDALTMMISHPWEGNVRELQNVVEYAVNMTGETYIRSQNLPQKMFKRISSDKINEVEVVPVDIIVKNAITQALEVFGRDLEGKNKAAQALGMSRATLYRKIKAYEIE